MLWLESVMLINCKLVRFQLSRSYLLPSVPPMIDDTKQIPIYKQAVLSLNE